MKSAIAHDKKSEFQRGWSFEGEEKTWGLFNGAGTGGTEGSVDRKVCQQCIFPENALDVFFQDHIDFGYPANKAFPNKWLPEEKIPGYREVMERFYDECAKVSQRLLMVLAIELGLPPREFADRCNKYESSTMRINHFPAMPVQDIDSGAASRIWPHFDLGCISLVFPDIVGGLEMENRQQPGSWIPVACGSRAELCVNLGEQWQSLVNGRIPAGLHRVTKPRAENEIVNGMAPERISLAFFCKMDFNASVGPLPQFVDKNHPPAYEDITALRFQQIRNRATY